jgi:hypothetical protein
VRPFGVVVNAMEAKSGSLTAVRANSLQPAYRMAMRDRVLFGCAQGRRNDTRGWFAEMGRSMLRPYIGPDESRQDASATKC